MPGFLHTTLLTVTFTDRRLHMRIISLHDTDTRDCNRYFSRQLNSSLIAGICIIAFTQHVAKSTRPRPLPLIKNLFRQRAARWERTVQCSRCAASDFLGLTQQTIVSLKLLHLSYSVVLSSIKAGVVRRVNTASTQLYHVTAMTARNSKIKNYKHANRNEYPRNDIKWKRAYETNSEKYNRVTITAYVKYGVRTTL